MAYVCIAILILICVCIKILILKVQLRKATLWLSSRYRRNPGYIYFFRGLHEPFYKIKIGRTNNPKARLKAHRTANPHGIMVLAVFQTKNDVKAEQFLHRYFAQNRISQHNEWFYWSLGMWLVMWLLRDETLTRRIRSWLR